MTRLRVGIHSATDVGRVREANEDNLFTGRTVFAVADGMGGHLAGEVASEMAIEPIAKLDGDQFASSAKATQALVDAIVAANAQVVGKAASDASFHGMGTTLTAVMLRDGRLHLAHVGDSRAYLLRAGEDLVQLTTDHTLVEQLVRDGRLSRDDIDTHPQRSVITRAIGVESTVEVDTLPPLALLPGDQVLLCSDGLSGPVKDLTMAGILTAHGDGDEAVRALVAAALDAGGPDNVTCVLLRVHREGDPRAEGTMSIGEAHTGEIRPIRTREESGEPWPGAMGRYADVQGVAARPHPGATPPPSRARRIGSTILAGVALLAIVLGGAWLLLSRAYFVGVDEGRVTIFHGIDEEVAGLPLHWVADQTDLRVTALPPLRRATLLRGITVATRSEADALVTTYREEAEAAASPSPSPSASPSASPSPSPSRSPSATSTPRPGPTPGQTPSATASTAPA